MSAQIVFLTLFLGLTSGVQPVALHVDGPVKSIRLLLGGRQVAALKGPPWSTTIDFGPLAPRRLEAIAYDASGDEIARASQLLNLPKPTAEFEIALENDGSTAALRWQHLMHLKPKSATLSVDGRPLSLGPDFRAALPKLDPLAPHILSAEMMFEDGFVGRKELVIQGLRSDSTGTELSPVLFWQSRAKPMANPADCFSIDGRPVRVSAVEKPRAVVVIVQEPFPGEAIEKFEFFLRAQSSVGTIHRFPLADDTWERLQWPIAESYGNEESTSVLFARSVDMPAQQGGMVWLLTRSFEDRKRLDDPRRFADAVAVAGLNATAGGLRRAVVLVLDWHKDASRYDPKAVREYLAALRVPLVLWSLSGPRPDVADSWGEVQDISSAAKLEKATEQLRRMLDSERVAWLATDPLTALHAAVKEECGLQPTR